MKHRLIHTLTAVFLTAVPWVATADSLTLTIPNVESSEGRIMVQLLASEAQFRGESPAYGAVQQSVTTGEYRLTFGSLPAGTYALRVMHDMDGDGKLNSNIVGMPTEPWVMSNNAVGNFGPPDWDAVKFTVDGHAEQVLTLNH